MFKLSNLFKRKFSSALYITGDKAQTNFVVLTPHIDFKKQIENKKKLIQSIKARNLNLDLDKIEKRWNFYQMINEHKSVLESNKNKIAATITKLKQESGDNCEEIEKLQLHVKLIKDDLKNVKDYSYGIEETANLAVLSLPNFLHPKTPIDNEIIIHKFSEKPQGTCDCHIDIGKSTNLIEYTSPSFCFLKSEASLFEFALTNFIQEKLLDKYFVQFSNADFAKSVVTEGCGLNHLDSKVFTLSCLKDDLNRLHIVGAGSLYSFMTYFTKHVIPSSLLPLKLFSLGRKYNPVNLVQNNLFNLSQYTVAQIFVITDDNMQKMDEILDSVIKDVINIYENLGYHFELVFAPASDLFKSESLKVSIKMFSNSLGKYIEVGNVSVYDSYLSERLLCTYLDKKDNKFVKIISGEVLNVQKLLGCVIENNFVKKEKLLTDFLNKYL